MEKQTTGPTRSIGGLVVAMLLAAFVGCGKSTTVTGKITCNGRAVTYGSIIFVGTDKTAHSAAIRPDGSYTVEGLPPGEFRIAVISRDPAKGRSVLRNHKPEPPSYPDAGRQAASSSGWFPLPLRLESPLNSGLSCTLDAGPVTYDLDLK